MDYSSFNLLNIKKIVIVFWNFLIVLLLGCSQSKPENLEMIGTWTNSDGAILQINKDGTFVGKSLPVGPVLMDNKKHVNEKFNCSGRWSIKASAKSWDQLPWSISLVFNEVSGMDNVGSAYLMISGSGFWENNTPWRYLFLWEGEEGGNKYEFKKEDLHH